MDMSDDDPLSALDLQPVRLADKALFDEYFRSLSEPLSDYTFSQVFTWSNSLRILWKRMHDHLCIFANGTGDLSLLMPPIGQGDCDKALREAFEVMDCYNAAHAALGRSRVEYASDELLLRLDRNRLHVASMGPDYLYDTQRMIDLAGGDLASKRQLRNRFLRNYRWRGELYDPDRHQQACLQLLRHWKQRQDCNGKINQGTSAVKRQKEALACELALRHAQELNLRGMVVYVAPASGQANNRPAEAEPTIGGFTFGETLGRDQGSIIIEKTDLDVRGLAQFIFSEFCRTCWSHRPLVNAGDDWGLETLAWTKTSYRPVKLLQKYELRLARPVQVQIPRPSGANEARVRIATRDDLPAALKLEQACFDTYCLTKRQLSYLQGRPSALFLVAEDAGHLVGTGISLVRKNRRGLSGRIYSLAIRREDRGRSIGQRLLREMMDQLQSRGVSRIYLEVEKDNAPAIRLYERNGFRRLRVTRDYYGPDRPALHMMWERSAPQAVGP